MAKFYPGGSGSGGTGSDECTLTKANLPTVLKAVTSDSDDESVFGTFNTDGTLWDTNLVGMGKRFIGWNSALQRFEILSGTLPDIGNVNVGLNCGQSYTPAWGLHWGSGKVTANSLASQTGGVSADTSKVVTGYTFWRDGVKHTGGLTVQSIVSFSVAPYSTSQLMATWQNPAKGPYSVFVICAKEGGYPDNPWDNQRFVGAGSNGNLSAMNSAIFGGLTPGRTYYVRCYTYCRTFVNGVESNIHSSPGQGVATTTNSARHAFTTSGNWTVPAGVRNIDIHCTGSGAAGRDGNLNQISSNIYGSGGSGGGRTAYKHRIPVSPGDIVTFVVGVGPANNMQAGNTSSVAINGITVVSAPGGDASRLTSAGSPGLGNKYGGHGGSGGGRGSFMDSEDNSYKNYASGDGGSDGRNGYIGGVYPNYGGTAGGNTDTGQVGAGQGTTTREFGESTGPLYSGGGGGASTYYGFANLSGYGGLGGGGAGAVRNGTSKGSIDAGHGTGGGGGGGLKNQRGGNGGSGNVIIRV